MHGAEIVYSEGSKYLSPRSSMALDMAQKDPTFYMPYQYGNQANPTRITTAPRTRSSITWAR